ncbi:MAG: hypothetical protein JWP37_938 [Mucilaginibacter sp.]|nr:hypothetical protein [Mucilaginibacter sp.]
MSEIKKSRWIFMPQSFAPQRSLIAFASAKFAMPLPALVAGIVLTDFGRSWFADRVGGKNLSWVGVNTNLHAKLNDLVAALFLQMSN